MAFPLKMQLKEASAPPLALAGLLWVLDGAGAVAFALGLALAIGALPAAGVAQWPWYALIVGGALLRAGAVFAASRVGAARARRLKRFLREQLMRAALRTPPGQAASLGERVAAVVDEVEALDGWFARFEPLGFASRLTPVLILAAVALASPIVALILIGALVPFALVMALAGMAAAEASRRQFDALAHLSGLFVDRVRALPVVLAFQAEQAEAAKVEGASRGVARRTLAVLKFAFLSSAGLEFFAALSVALVAVYCGFNLLGLLPFPVPEQLDLPRAIFVLALAPELYLPLRRLAAAYHDKQLGQAAAERLARVLDGPRAPEPAGEVVSTAPAIRFEAAAVRHPEGPLIGPVSFTAPAGGVTALLGPSGSGKTSLLSLLVGAAPLADGEVFVGDRPLSQTRSFARSVAWAGQTPVLAPGSIADNIALGRSDAPPETVAQASRLAGLDAALERRPDGLATQLDERGSGLSGGERRRIGLARAWLKPAPILLLDEPSADLDEAAEQEVIARLRELAKGRTVLVATHSERLAAQADHVVRLA